MRTILRILFALMFVVGALLGVVYPQAAQHVAGYEIGRWRVFDRENGFRPAEAMLAAPEAPVFVTVELRADAPLMDGAVRSVLTVTALDAGEKAMFHRDLGFAGPGVRESPQSDIFVYREEPGSMEESDGRHSFVVEPGIDFEASIISVDLILNAGAFDLDPRAEPAGYVLLALGVVGFFMTLRRRKPQDRPARRWGRGDGK